MTEVIYYAGPLILILLIGGFIIGGIIEGIAGEVRYRQSLKK